jgi:2'-5' RNA ligase
MNRTVRLFIATDLPASAAAALEEVQARLRREALALRLEEVANMHLTLFFLGNTDATYVPRLGPLVRAAGAQEQPFELHLGQVNAFPGLAAPRVVWVGIEGAIDTLTRLAGRISSTVSQFGPARELRPFHPHVTIGRIRTRATRAERQRVGDVLRGLPSMPPIAWVVDGIVLYESRTSAAGRSYHALATVPLGQAGSHSGGQSGP